MTSALAPIALFVYARPAHTRRTLEALAHNHDAQKSCLYVFSDGPSENTDPATIEGIDQVRRLIRERSWCGQVEITESDSNKGLAASIVEGVGFVSNKHGRAIILEDDLETSRGFLRYMNDALETYQDQDRVMQVSGFNVKNWPWAAQTGFLRVSTSWGWATWDRAWQHYNDDAVSLLSRIEQRGRAEFDLDGHSFHFEELQRNAIGELKTWAVRWYASLFLRAGLCLYPRQTMVRNLGFDGSGVNCFDDETDYHRRLRLAESIDVSRRPLKEDPAYLKAMQRHYDGLKQLWTKTRLRDRIARKAKSFVSRAGK